MRLRGKRTDLEHELRAGRPKPPADLESTLETQITADRRQDQQRAPRARLGFAAATTVALIVAFAAAGGMAAASSSVRSAFTDVARVVHIAAPNRQAAPDSALTPAVDQYGRKKSCVKAAVARRTAALKAAHAKLKRDLVRARVLHAKSIAKAAKRYTASAKTKLDIAKHVAAVKAANAKFRRERAAAWKKHAQLVKAALARYGRDVKKCPIV